MIEFRKVSKAYKNNIIADLSLNAKAVDNLYNDEILQPK